jgi:hypothetical protein
MSLAASSERGGALGQHEGVVPVPADLRAGPGGLVAGSQFQGAVGGQLRQQGALHAFGGVLDLGVQAGVVHRESDPVGKIVHQRQIVLVQCGAVLAAHQAEDPQCLSSRAQRAHHRAVRAQAGEQVLLFPSQLIGAGVRTREVAGEQGSAGAQGLCHQCGGVVGERRQQFLEREQVMGITVLHHDPVQPPLLVGKVDRAPVAERGHQDACQPPQRFLLLERACQHLVGLARIVSRSRACWTALSTS